MKHYFTNHFGANHAFTRALAKVTDDIAKKATGPLIDLFDKLGVQPAEFLVWGEGCNVELVKEKAKIEWPESMEEAAMQAYNFACKRSDIF